MAVVTGYGTGYKDPASLNPVSAVYAEGTEKSINSQTSIANGDSATSVYYVGKVPSNALISSRSQVSLAANAGLTDYSLGFAGAPKALMSDVDVHLGGNFPATSAVAAANYIKRAWELAGLASDPGGMLDIFATIGAASQAATLVHHEIIFKKA